jgi:hypothetical protein
MVEFNRKSLQRGYSLWKYETMPISWLNNWLRRKGGWPKGGGRSVSVLAVFVFGFPCFSIPGPVEFNKGEYAWLELRILVSAGESWVSIARTIRLPWFQQPITSPQSR